MIKPVEPWPLPPGVDLEDEETELDVTPAGIKGGQGRTGVEVEDSARLALWALVGAIFVFLAGWALHSC